MTDPQPGRCGCGHELSMVEQTAGQQRAAIWCSGMLDLSRWRHGKRTSHDIYNQEGHRLGKGTCQRKARA